MKRRIHTPRVAFGLLLTIAGLFMTADNLGWLDYDFNLFQLWPLILIAVGVAKIMSRDWSGGLLALLIGGAFLTALLHPGLSISDILDRWPLILILVGVNVLFSRDRTSRAERRQAHTGMAVLRSVRAEDDSDAYEGDGLTALVGGYVLDLTHARLAPAGATIDVFAFWGGIELRVPADWSVDLKVVPFMGGAEDKTRSPGAEPDAPRLAVRGFVLMGGIEVKN